MAEEEDGEEKLFFAGERKRQSYQHRGFFHFFPRPRIASHNT